MPSLTSPLTDAQRLRLLLELEFAKPHERSFLPAPGLWARALEEQLLARSELVRSARSLAALPAWSQLQWEPDTPKTPPSMQQDLTIVLSDLQISKHIPWPPLPED
jgi:hypothetical protein